MLAALLPRTPFSCLNGHDLCHCLKWLYTRQQDLLKGQEKCVPSPTRGVVHVCFCVRQMYGVGDGGNEHVWMLVFALLVTNCCYWQLIVVVFAITFPS